MSTQAIATRTQQGIAERETLQALLQRPAYVARFNEVLGTRGPQFMASLLSIGRTMPDVEPKSIIGSAMIAATLDLPIEKSLGFAWIVPYRDGDRKYASFQIGQKGLVQLALRTGRYTRMNARKINQEAVGGFDEVGEPKIDWDKVDETKEAVGYAFAFKLEGGFAKVCYWSKEKVMAHAQRYSQAYRKGSGPWKTHFDQMALKTVIANEISDWGILSVQFQKARAADQTVTVDIDAEPIHIDNVDMSTDQIEDRKAEPTAFQQATQPAAPAQPSNVTPLPAQPAPTTAPPPETVPKQGRVKRQGAGKPASEPQPAQGVVTPPTPSNPPPAPASAQPTPVQQAAAPETDSDEAEEAAAGLAPVQAPQEAPPAAAAPAPQTPPPPIAPFTPRAGESEALTSVRLLLHKSGKTEDQVLAWLRANKAAKDNQKLADLSETKLINTGRCFNSFLTETAGK